MAKTLMQTYANLYTSIHTAVYIFSRINKIKMAIKPPPQERHMDNTNNQFPQKVSITEPITRKNLPSILFAWAVTGASMLLATYVIRNFF